MSSVNCDQLPPWNSDLTRLTIVIETPKGSRNKFDYEPDRNLFRLKSVLPLGAQFPFDFGFIPSTEGEDGDPLDVLVLMDEPAFPGCLIYGRLLGVIEAEQTEKGKTIRNDRLVAVAHPNVEYDDVRSLKKLDSVLLDQIEYFFISYNKTRGKRFKPLGRFGPKRAVRLIEQGMDRFRRHGSRRAEPKPNGAVRKKQRVRD